MSLVERNKKRIPPPNFKMTVEKELVSLIVIIICYKNIKVNSLNKKNKNKGKKL